MSTLPGFRRQLAELAERQGATLTPWPPPEGRSSRNLMQLSTATKTIVLYVKEFNIVERPGFWGLTKNQVDRLTNANWFAVLLLRSSVQGYVLSWSEVQDHITNGSFKLSKDGDYKVNEDVGLESQQMFHSLECLLSQIFHQ